MDNISAGVNCASTFINYGVMAHFVSEFSERPADLDFLVKKFLDLKVPLRVKLAV